MSAIKMIKIAIIITIILLTYLIWYFRPQYVRLELVDKITNSSIDINIGKEGHNSEFHWWFIDSNELRASEQTMAPDFNSELVNSYPENLLTWGIDFDALGIDFNENNVILAFSREIKEMKFKKADNFPYQVVSTVRTLMSKDFEASTIYVYKISKYNVREDLRAYTETTVEK